MAKSQHTKSERQVIHKRSRSTQWAAQFAVASELCKRGYEVALTMGHNAPIADLMCISPKTKKAFLVDVKGLYKENRWQITKKEDRPNLFYILAFVPTDAPNRFCILRQSEVNKLIDFEIKRLKRSKDYKRTSFRWRQGLFRENHWLKLPK